MRPPFITTIILAKRFANVKRFLSGAWKVQIASWAAQHIAALADGIDHERTEIIPMVIYERGRQSTVHAEQV